MKHTPEPWCACSTEPAEIRTHPCGGTLIGHTIPNAHNTDRIVACVNALAGIEDPAEAIKAAQDALQLLISVGCEFYDMDMGENGSLALQEARAALRKLGKEPE